MTRDFSLVRCSNLGRPTLWLLSSESMVARMAARELHPRNRHDRTIAAYREPRTTAQPWMEETSCHRRQSRRAW